jgi:hypothetical protein
MDSLVELSPLLKKIEVRAKCGGAHLSSQHFKSREREEDHSFKANVYYLTRPYLKKKKGQ